MQIPIPFKDLLPIETVKQLSQLVAQPALVSALKDAAQKLGINKESLHPSNLQHILQQAGRWMESVAEPWMHSLQPGLMPGVNATGELFSSRWCTHRLSAEVISMHARLQTQYAETNKLDVQLRHMLMGVTGAPSALVMPNLSVALYLIAKMKAADGKKHWVLPRMDCIRLPQSGSSSGANVRSILDFANLTTTEIGSVQDCSQLDFESSLRNSNATLLLASPNSSSHDARSSHRKWAYAAAQECDAKVVEVVLDGAIHDLNFLGLPSRNLSQSWEKQTEFLVVPGDCLIGGPECAIVLGPKDSIDALNRQTEAIGWSASNAAKAMLLRTIQISDRIEGWEKLPIGSTLTTSLENLENRSKRLLIQLEGLSDFERVAIERKPIRIGAGAWGNTILDSWVIQLFPKTAKASALGERMASFPIPIWGNVQSDHVELVLRSINADEDRLVVQQFVPPNESI